MRALALATLFALVAMPAAGLAQTAPPISPAAPAPAPGGAAGKPEGISRDDYIKRAADNAAARFDRMDADHDGVLTREETRAYREAHRRVRHTSSPAPKQQ